MLHLVPNVEFDPTILRLRVLSSTDRASGATIKYMVDSTAKMDV